MEEDLGLSALKPDGGYPATPLLPKRDPETGLHGSRHKEQTFPPGCSSGTGPGTSRRRVKPAARHSARAPPPPRNAAADRVHAPFPSSAQPTPSPGPPQGGTSQRKSSGPGPKPDRQGRPCVFGMWPTGPGGVRYVKSNERSVNFPTANAA